MGWILGASAATALAACHMVSGLDAFVERQTASGGGGGSGVGGTSTGGMGGEGGAVSGCVAPGTNDPCTGEVLWVRQLHADEGDIFLRAVSVGPDGSIYIGGYARGLVTFDGGAPFGEPGENGWLIKLTAEGDFVWRRRMTGNTYQAVTAVAATPDGGVVVVGEFWDEVILQDGPNIDNPDDAFENSFIARYDADGAFLWSRHFQGIEDERIRNVAVDAMGRIVVVGEFGVEVNIPGGPTLTEAGNNGSPRRQVFVAMRNASGGHLWAREYGSDLSSQRGYTVAFANDGNPIIGGNFFESIDFGLGALTVLDEQDSFLVKLDAGDPSTPLWQTWIRGDDDEYVWGIDVCPDGSLAVAGAYTSALFVGEGPDHATLDEDLWLARLTADGDHIESDGLPGTTNDVGYNRMIRCDPDGRLVLAGTIDADDNPFGFTPAGSEDGFVAKLDDAGGAFWVQRLGGGGIDQAKNLALNPDGSILVGGNFDQAITIGDSNLSYVGPGENVFLVKLAP